MTIKNVTFTVHLTPYNKQTKSRWLQLLAVGRWPPLLRGCLLPLQILNELVAQFSAPTLEHNHLPMEPNPRNISNLLNHDSPSQYSSEGSGQFSPPTPQWPNLSFPLGHPIFYRTSILLVLQESTHHMAILLSYFKVFTSQGVGFKLAHKCMDSQMY